MRNIPLHRSLAALSEFEMDFLSPPCSIKVERRNGVSSLIIRVTLHRIPEKYIEFEVLEDRLKLNTEKYTKKFVLDKQFPNGIKVIADPQPDATLEYGILTLSLPIQHDNKSSQSKAKTTVSSRLKLKADLVPIPIKNNVGKIKKAKRKVFIDKGASLALLDQINTKQEEEIEQQLDKEKKKHLALEKKEAERIAKKERREALKDAVKSDLKQRLSKKREFSKEQKVNNKRSRKS